MKQIDLLKKLFLADEEYHPTLTDKYERTLYSFSSNRNPNIPYVSNLLKENGFSPSYPNGKKIAVCISHDIDVLYNNDKINYVSDALRRKQGIPSKYYFKKLVGKAHYPLWKIENLLDIHQQYDIRSSYYFLALAQGEQDYNFDVEKEGEIIKLLQGTGNEVGLHGGHTSYNNIDSLLKEKQRLARAVNHPVVGYRNHYLRFNTPLTWNLLEQAGFKYDTTFGYADRVGFRNGMCYPFQPYDNNQKRFLDILEIPLIAMDCSFFEIYMRLDPKRALVLIDELLDSIEAVGGVFSLLWHNSYLQKPYLGFYELVLKQLAKRDCWFATGAELTDWWKTNKYNEQINESLSKVFELE